MAAVIVWPPISTLTCAVVAPFFTSTILPLSRLRALIFMAPLLVAVASRPRRIGIGEEQFLPVDLVIRDRLLTLGRDEPVDEGLAESLLDVRMLFGIDQHDAVLVEQALVAGDEDVEIAAVLEREPGAAVGEHVGIGGGRGVERRAHALADLLVPGTFLLADVDAGGLPEFELAIWVRERSPREMKGAPLDLMAFKASATSVMPLMPAGSLFGPIRTKSLYITGYRLTL